MLSNDSIAVLRIGESNCTCSSLVRKKQTLHGRPILISPKEEIMFGKQGSSKSCEKNFSRWKKSSVAVFISLLVPQILAMADASTIRQIGDAALCPFEAKQDRDDTRVPAVITQLTCKFSKSMIANSDDEDPSPGDITCEQIGGTCKQIHTNLQVSYSKMMTPNRAERSVRGLRTNRSLRRHHNIRVNSACVCVMSNGKPASPISPNVEGYRR